MVSHLLMFWNAWDPAGDAVWEGHKSPGMGKQQKNLGDCMQEGPAKVMYPSASDPSSQVPSSSSAAPP